MQLTSPPDARLWRASVDSIVYREWDDELVVFNETTGHTHHIGPLGCAVLLALLARPRGLKTDEVLRALYGTPDEAEPYIPAIERILHELIDLELVACTPG
jgi:PqqD family protein of HPr-rel-A system